MESVPDRPTTLASLPTVTLAWAQTLDGRLATRGGSSRWISGPESLRMTHALRAAHDAIAVGAGTVVRDDPRLTVRLVAGCNPLRVVVDSTLRVPLDAAVFAGDAATGTLLAVTARTPPERRAAAAALGARVLVLPADAAGQVDLRALLAELGALGIRSLMVEGGARLLTALLHARLVDRLVVTIAPLVLGSGTDAVGDLAIDDLAQALRLAHVRWERYGDDIVVDGRLTDRESPA